MNVRTKDISSLDDEVKLAAAFYLYLALGNTSAQERTKHFETLFDPRQNIGWFLELLGRLEPGEALPEDIEEFDAFFEGRIKKPDIIENYSFAIPDFSEAKQEAIDFAEGIITSCEDDERYEEISETIDCLLLQDFFSPYKRMFGLFRNRESSNLKYLWVLTVYSINAGLLTGEKRKYLKHFCRITNIETSVFSGMEEAAKRLIELGRKRKEVLSSSESYKSVRKTLSSLENEEEALQKSIAVLLGLSGDCDEDDEEEDEEDEDYDNSIGDKIADGVIGVITGVTDAVTGVIDGLSDFITDRM